MKLKKQFRLPDLPGIRNLKKQFLLSDLPGIRQEVG